MTTFFFPVFKVSPTKYIDQLYRQVSIAVLLASLPLANFRTPVLYVSFGGGGGGHLYSTVKIRLHILYFPQPGVYQHN